MEKQIVYSGFPPLCGEGPRILLLGTFPSPLSREKGEYYGNPRNQFWGIVCEIYNRALIGADYEKRKAILYANGIAVWDVISQCEAGGALDSTIRNPLYNVDIPEFLAQQGISKVFFNGNNAYYFYRRGIGDIEKNVLPSTSPAYATMRLSEKLRLWHKALTGEED